MRTMRTILIALVAALAAPVGLNAQSSAAIGQGAQVWAANCTRCHNARPSSERTDGQWLTIVLHMRARANLTRADADLVATYLKATNQPESAMAVEPAPAPAVGPGTDDDEGGSDARDAPDLATLIRYLQSLKSGA